MEEKERYSWYNHSAEEIYDNKENIVFVGTITVLNQQNRRIWELIEENKQLKQSQKQLAIKELEKLKEKLSSMKWCIDSEENTLVQIIAHRVKQSEIIDNQINELKEKVE